MMQSEMHVLEVVAFAFTFRLWVEDDHRGGGGRLEGFAQREQLFGSRERLRERRKLFERDIGWQSGIQSQHGCHNAVGQQTFWLHTENRQKDTEKQICCITFCWYYDSIQVTVVEKFFIIMTDNSIFSHF